MKVTRESTTKIVELVTEKGTIPARIWEGETESGVKVHAYITRIAVNAGADCSQCESELRECRQPSPKIAATIPARLIL